MTVTICPVTHGWPGVTVTPICALFSHQVEFLAAVTESLTRLRPDVLVVDFESLYPDGTTRQEKARPREQCEGPAIGNRTDVPLDRIRQRRQQRRGAKNGRQHRDENGARG